MCTSASVKTFPSEALTSRDAVAATFSEFLLKEFYFNHSKCQEILIRYKKHIQQIWIC